MINLIPKEEKKMMMRRFYYRLIVLFVVMFGFISMILFVSLLPSYFFSSVKKNVINEKLEMQKKESVSLPDQQTLTIIEDLNKKMNLIENAEKNQFLVSQKIINAVILKKMPTVKITDILYEDNSPKGKKINVEGTAPSREILLSFRRALEGDIAFSQVDLPISNFVKGSNIKFFLSLIPYSNKDSAEQTQ